MQQKLIITIALLVTTALLVACGQSAPAAETAAPVAEQATPAASEEGAAEEEAAEAAVTSEDTTAESSEAATSKSATDESTAADGDLAALKTAALATYADIVYAGYEDAHALTATLQEALEAFVANPSAETQQAAKDAWLAAREVYGQTEAFRFYGGPIDDEDGPEGLINAWPLDEAYIDYVEDAPEAGIINNTEDYPELSKELIASLNEAGAEENISAGYHAIEFLLWGQDFSEDGAGQRSFTDYVVDGEVANADRRGQYLLLVGEQLVENLAEVKDAWDPAGADNYRSEFLAMEPDAALQNIFTSLGVLSKSELAGERMFTALDNQDQEDEHSCFSDNTHRDIIANNQGIINVYTGSYTRPDGTVVAGTAVADVVATVDAELNDRMLGLLEQSSAATQAIHVPFDQAIVLPEARNQVLETVFALQDQGDLVAQVASTLGLTINTALPE